MERGHPGHPERHGVVTLHPHLIELYSILFDYMESLTPRQLRAFLDDMRARAFPPQEPVAPHIMGQTPVHIPCPPWPEGSVYVQGFDASTPLWVHTDEAAQAGAQDEDVTGT